jgi:hypothetical protein
MTKLPDPVDFGYRDEAGNWNIQFGYTEAQMLQFRHDALEELALLNWTEIVREGALVTWHDAETLGDRVIEKIDAMKDET